MKKVKRIVPNGQTYEAPRAESVEVKNQGVLCASGAKYDAGVKGFGGTGW